MQTFIWYCRRFQGMSLEEVVSRTRSVVHDIVDGYRVSVGRYTQRARSIPNVRLHGRVMHVQMEQLYRQAFVLCNSSTHEGFPNTFLEA